MDRCFRGWGWAGCQLPEGVCGRVPCGSCDMSPADPLFPSPSPHKQAALAGRVARLQWARPQICYVRALGTGPCPFLSQRPSSHTSPHT